MNLISRGTGDLYHRYRPQRFSEIVGQDSVVSSLSKALSGSAFLLVGPSGTGKTTTARIMALAVNCLRDDSVEPCLECENCMAVSCGECPDVIEVNAADTRGIDAIRSMVANMPYAPMQARRRVYILDECHQLTSEAQNTLLKHLEDAPHHVMMILCSTDPKKIIKTVKTRCQTFKFKPLGRGDMFAFLKEVAGQETEHGTDDLWSSICDVSGGSPRQALVLLQQVLQLDDRGSESVAALLDTDESDQTALNLCFVMTAKEPSWRKIVSTYEEVKHLGTTTLGITLAGYFRNKLLKAPNPASAVRYSNILELFLGQFDSGKRGENQLVHALFKAFQYSMPAETKALLG